MYGVGADGLTIKSITIILGSDPMSDVPFAIYDKVASVFAINSNQNKQLFYYFNQV